MRDYHVTKYNLTELDITVARRIRNRREELGLTQNKLADLVGVSRPCITQIEMGRNKVKHNLLKKIADSLGKSVSYFLGDENKDLEHLGIEIGTKEFQDMISNWKIRSFLTSKQLPEEFIKDVELSIEYLCELHGVDINNVW